MTRDLTGTGTTCLRAFRGPESGPGDCMARLRADKSRPPGCVWPSFRECAFNSRLCTESFGPQSSLLSKTCQMLVTLDQSDHEWLIMTNGSQVVNNRGQLFPCTGADPFAWFTSQLRLMLASLFESVRMVANLMDSFMPIHQAIIAGWTINTCPDACKTCICR